MGKTIKERKKEKILEIQISWRHQIPKHKKEKKKLGK